MYLLFALWASRCLPAVLLCSCVMNVGVVAHLCDFDRLMKNMSGRGLPVVDHSPVPPSDLLHASAGGVTDEWKAIRFKVFQSDVEDASKYCGREGEIRSNFGGVVLTCGRDSVLTGPKRALLSAVVRDAVKMHSDRLMVQPINGKLRVPIVRGFCANFNIPKEHHTTGVADADMVLYGAAGPMGTPAAWAGSCAVLSDGRPFVGVFNIGPEVLVDHDDGMRVVAHEIAHALGFGFEFMQKGGLVTSVTGIRGKGSVWVVSSPTVVKMARIFFGCDEITGVELEDQGGEGTINSHWEQRVAMGEMMAGKKTTGGSSYSVLTMALFEDMRFYRAVWGTEENMHWGNGAGCDFLKKKCIENGKSNFPDLFCTSKTKAGEGVCSADRMGLGSCTIETLTTPIPAHSQYFPQENLGGTGELLDFCPVVGPFSNTRCANGEPEAMWGSRIGPKSRCVKGSGLKMAKYLLNVGDICVEVDCSAELPKVRFVDDEQWYDCPEGEQVTSNVTFSSGHIICPKMSDLCSVRIVNVAPADHPAQKSATREGCSPCSVWASMLFFFFIYGLVSP